MIDYEDYIRHRIPSGKVILKYQAYCDECGQSRGYQRKDRGTGVCRSCASKKHSLSEEARQKISEGVKKYYDEIHNHKEIQTEVPKKKRVCNTIIEEKWKRIHRDAKNKDKKYPEGTRYDFSDTEIQEFLQQPCYYCGSPCDGLDRIDNDLGHCKSNCIPCCTLCNLTRGRRFTVEEFKLIGEVIKIIKEKREKEENLK